MTRKTVIFIVEGNTDKTALENIFRKIYRHKNINVEVTHGDITSDTDIEDKDLEEVIFSLVKKYINENKLRKSDIWQIVQIFDTDGTYVPESAIVHGNTKEFFYTESTISCKNRQKIIDRNKMKSRRMEYLLQEDNINDIPYKCYFMSSNLDHALYDEQNLTDDEKREYADQFYDLFAKKPEVFIEFLNRYVVNGVPNSYLASWRYIKEDLNSLNRHTNLHIYFKDNPYGF
jgi:hypothetical protein